MACEMWKSSENLGFLHDAEELGLVDLAVPVHVRLVDHLLQLLVGQVLTELFAHSLQVLKYFFTREILK